MSDPTAALRAISGAEPSDTAVGLPNIPAVPFTDDASLTNFLQSAKLWMEKAMGAGLTGFATKKDLIRNGLLGTDAKGNLVPTGGVPNLAIPPVPTGLQANGAMTNILLEWDNPFQAYGNHGYTEIWAAETNNFTNAVLVGESGGFTFPHAVGEDSTRYYWIRFVSSYGIKGPYNSVNGTLGQTAPNPQYLLDTLTGQLTESQLYADLSARIDLIDGPSTTIGTIPFQLAQLQGQINDLSNYPTYDNATTYATGDIVTYNGAIYKAKSTTTGNLPTNTTYWLKIGDYSSLADAVAAHTTEIATLTANDAAQASQITSLTATVEGYNATTNAALVAEQTTRANADSALSQQITTLNATVETNQSSLLASLQTEQTTRANADSALSQEITTLTAAVQDNQSSLNSAIQSESTARADADSALTTQVNTAYSAATKTRTYSQNDAPTSDMIEGDLWFDANDGYKAYRYTGTQWSPTDDTRIAGNVAAIESEATTRADETSALATSINILLATVEDNNTTLSAAIDSEATTRADEDAVLAELITAISSRLDTGGDVANAIVQTQATANTAVTNAEAAQGTADSKVRTYAQAEEPTADLVTGDLWIDTGDNNRLYRWNGSDWVDARDTSANTAFNNWISNTYDSDKSTLKNQIDAKVETWFQDADPETAWTTDDLKLQHDGDLWYSSTSKLFQRYARTGTNVGEWTQIDDATAVSAAAAAAAAQSTADSRITTFYQSSPPGANAVGDLWMDSSDNNRLYRWNGSDWVDAADVRITTTASLVTDIQTTVNDHTTSIQTNAESIDGIQGKYTVKIDNNGYVTGYGLISEDNNGTPTSEFMVVADKFSIAQVASNSNADSPFFHLTSPTTINGVEVPAGTYMKAAFIHDAAITNAQIHDLAADKITAGTIDAARIGANTITADKINGTNLAVVNGTFSGSLQAATGTFTGALSAATGTFSGRLTAGTLDPSVFAGRVFTYNTPGVYTITVPTDTGWSSISIRFTLQGAGGGGGGVQSMRRPAGAGGGGAGTSITITINSLTPGQTYTLVVGAGGGGGYGYANGAAGGATTLLGYSASGGAGGGGALGGENTVGIGAGGSIGGQSGYAFWELMVASQAYGGAGGSSVYGSGGARTYPPQGWGSTGLGGGIGAGGSGASSLYNDNYNFGGGAGGGGYALIEFFDPNAVVTNTRYQNLIAWLDKNGHGAVPQNAR